MLNTVRAVVREGRIELLEPIDLPEGTTVLVTPLIEEDTLFWAHVSHVALGSALSSCPTPARWASRRHSSRSTVPDTGTVPDIFSALFR
jgi:hypothetical protein